MLVFLSAALAASATVAHAGTKSCTDDVLQHVPHMATAYQFLELEQGDPFTLFAPSIDGAAKLTKLFLHEGCDTISAIRLGDLASAGMLRGQSLDIMALSADPVRYDATTSEGTHTLMLARVDGVEQMSVLDAAGAIVDVIEVIEPTVIDVCGGSRLYIIDDMIVPPSLRSRIHQVLDNLASGCSEDIAGGDGDDNEPLESGSGLLTGANVSLSTENVDAKFPIEARLDTVAIDSQGNVIPLKSDIDLDIETTLVDIRRFQSNQVDVQVPITVNVTVDAGDDCSLDGASLTIPIDVKVRAELVVEGQTVGSGTENALFGRCDADEAQVWKQCAGINFPSGHHSAPRFFQKHCSSGICIQKNHAFAQCLPREHRKVFKWEQGWTGKMLECRD